MPKTVKMSPALMRRLIEEEIQKFGEVEPTEDRAEDVEEVDADELADSLANKIDYIKALKIEETRLTRRLAYIKEERARLVVASRKSK